MAFLFKVPPHHFAKMENIAVPFGPVFQDSVVLLSFKTIVKFTCCANLNIHAIICMQLNDSTQLNYAYTFMYGFATWF